MFTITTDHTCTHICIPVDPHIYALTKCHRWAGHKNMNSDLSFQNELLTRHIHKVHIVCKVNLFHSPIYIIQTLYNLIIYDTGMYDGEQIFNTEYTKLHPPPKQKSTLPISFPYLLHACIPWHFLYCKATSNKPRFMQRQQANFLLDLEHLIHASYYCKNHGSGIKLSHTQYFEMTPRLLVNFQIKFHHLLPTPCSFQGHFV